jgi:hypothetical protein
MRLKYFDCIFFKWKIHNRPKDVLVHLTTTVHILNVQKYRYQCWYQTTEWCKNTTQKPEQTIQWPKHNDKQWCTKQYTETRTDNTMTKTQWQTMMYKTVVRFRFYQVFSGVYVRFRFYQVFIGIHVNLSYIRFLVGFM